MSDEYTGETIDITPTWAGIMPGLIEVWCRGTAPEAKHDAFVEMQRMARLADKYVRLVKLISPDGVVTRPNGMTIDQILALVKER